MKQTLQLRLFVLVICLFAFVGIVCTVLIRLSEQRAIRTYEECVQSVGSRVLEMYPPICVTSSGRQFVANTESSSHPFLRGTLDYAMPQREYTTASSAARLFHAVDGSVALQLPAGWTAHDLSPRAYPLKDYGYMVELRSAQGRSPNLRLILATTDQLSARSPRVFSSLFVPASGTIASSRERFGDLEFEKTAYAENGVYVDTLFARENQAALGILMPYRSEGEREVLRTVLGTLTWNR